MSIDGETLSHRVHRTSVFGKRCVDFGFNVGADGSNTWTDAGQVGGFGSAPIAAPSIAHSKRLINIIEHVGNEN